MGAILSSNKWIKKSYLIKCQAKNAKTSLAMLCRDHDATMEYKVRATIIQYGDNIRVDIYAKKKKHHLPILRELKLFCDALFLPRITSLDVARRNPPVYLPEELAEDEENISYVFKHEDSLPKCSKLTTSSKSSRGLDVGGEGFKATGSKEHTETKENKNLTPILSNYTFEFRFTTDWSSRPVSIAESRNFRTMKDFLEFVLTKSRDKKTNKYRIRVVTDTDDEPFEDISQMDGLLRAWELSSPKKSGLAKYRIHLITEKPKTVQCLWLDDRINSVRY